MRKIMNNRQGFTLIELMIVVVIIGILAALAIPRFFQATVKTRQSEAKFFLKQITTNQLTYKVDSPTGNYFSSAATASAGNPNAFQGLGVEIPPGAEYSYTCVLAGADFLATATANLDDDATIDTWTINSAGVLTNTIDDVIN